MTEKTRFDDFILQKRQMENPNLEQLTIALCASLSPEQMSDPDSPFKGLTWPQDHEPSITCSSNACVAILGGWLLRQTIDPSHLTDYRISDLNSMIYSHFDYIENLENRAGEIIAQNLEFFANKGNLSYRGVFFSMHEQFTWHPAISHQSAFRAIQASLASRTVEHAPLIHIHRTGPQPATQDEARKTAEWLQEEMPKLDGIIHHRVLNQGTPYTISVIDQEASKHTHDLYDFDPGTTDNTPPPVSFIGLQ